MKKSSRRFAAYGTLISGIGLLVAQSTTPANAASSGTVGRIGKFTNTVDLGDSVMFESSGRIGVGTISPLDTLSVAFNNGTGTVTGYAVQNTNTGASAYSGMLFYDATGALGLFQGFNNATKEYRINNIASGGSISMRIASNPVLTADSAANVGIGTTTPSYRLDVQHGGATGIRVASSSSFSVLDISATSGDAAIRFQNAGAGQWNLRNQPGTDDFQLFELGGGGERLKVVNNTGQVTIGTSTSLGSLVVNGPTTATGTKSFTIDHPLDPTKTLSHASAESNEVINFYSGNVTTDATGKATVSLPAYFDAINKDPRYQLTTIGSFAQVMVSKEEANNKFEIATSLPNIKVSWEVKALRNDAYMQAHPYQAEKLKPVQGAAAHAGPSSTDG